MPDTPRRRAADDAIALRTLAPSYKEEQHGIYVSVLAEALRATEDVRNIALTGAYGTGKSSVLKHLTELAEFKERVLELSLSTVGVMEKRPDGESDTNPASWTTTNLIQKEIVKQILYRDPPSKTRGSRFRRISRFRWASEIGVAAGIGFLVWVVLWITGLNAQITVVLGKNPALGMAILVNAALFAVLSGIVYAVRWLTHGRVFLEKFSAGPATVALTSTSSSYFDQYIDEIVYYFEQSGRDIVVFEDIDRFEDVHIFEALRALNTLLNGSEQVRRRRRTGANRGQTQDIKFVYALRDSVFEKLGEGSDDDADYELRRANRTKFFDIVIPIVPFITHRNSRDLLFKAMEGTGVSREIINVAAAHVADMRLITDMRNEYEIYADRLLGAKSPMPGLDADRLFALIAYKCVHMADFEAIRFGRSKLDALYDAWRGIVGDSLSNAYARERHAARQLALPGTTEARARSLGDRLEPVARALAQNQSYIAATHVKLNGKIYLDDQLRAAAFWNELTESGASIEFGNRQTGWTFSISRQQLETLMGVSLDPDEWRQPDRHTERQAQLAARNDIRFLRHNDWGEIYSRPEFTTSTGDGEAESFAEATDRILSSRLAQALVAAGYLNEYFALYVSIYYGDHLRPRALNFVIHVLDRGVGDIQYELDPDDVEAIIRDKGLDIFRDRAAYNIQILDHLLTSRPTEADLILEQIRVWDREDRVFCEMYVQAGNERVKFIRRIAELLPSIVASIVTDAPEDVLAELIDAALDYAGVEIEGGPGSEFNGLVVENYDRFPSISVAAQSKSSLRLRKPQTIDAIAKLGVQLPFTSVLDSTARNRALELGAYELNAANIADLTGQPSLALDEIRAKSSAVFHTALGRIEKYLAIVAEVPNAATVANSDAFTSILEEAERFGLDAQSLSGIVTEASKECRVEDLNDAPQAAWPVLAATRRTAASAHNLLAYLDDQRAFDANIGALLAGASAIEAPATLTDDEQLRLAVAILNARSIVPSVAQRVELAASLELESHIHVGSLTPERGEFVGRLIEADLISDDALTFGSNLIVDWPTREAAFARSRGASAFLSPASLPPEHVSNFFQSATVAASLKDAAISNLAAFLPGASSDALHVMATYALTSSADLPFETVDRLRVSGASDAIVAGLLGWSDSASLDEVRAALRSLDDPYRTLADRGTARPLVPDDAAHRRLLDRLKASEIVSDHKPEGGSRRVTLRRP